MLCMLQASRGGARKPRTGESSGDRQRDFVYFAERSGNAEAERAAGEKQFGEAGAGSRSADGGPRHGIRKVLAEISNTGKQQM